jgi:hypothetical protein
VIRVTELSRVEPSPAWPYRWVCRLFDQAGDAAALHAFARLIGIGQRWFIDDGALGRYYRLGRDGRRRALVAGASSIDDSELRELYRPRGVTTCRWCGSGLIPCRCRI